METYHFMSTNTGELATDFPNVVKVTIHNLLKYKFITFWKYSKCGF
jgi:hypothetical protein